MLAAGLLAKKAVERGLTRQADRQDLARARLARRHRVSGQDRPAALPRQLGFQTVGYGCTTCIGNSGPLEPHLEKTVTDNDLVVAQRPVRQPQLRGARASERQGQLPDVARRWSSPSRWRAAWTSTCPPSRSARTGTAQDVYLQRHLADPGGDRRGAAGGDRPGDLPAALQRLRRAEPALAGDPQHASATSTTGTPPTPTSRSRPTSTASAWSRASSRDIHNARPLAIFGDSVTTDHISPAGAIKPSSPAGLYLQQRTSPVEDFNSYGSRRGNDRVMMRGTFANVRIKNLMVPGVEGGDTVYQPDGEQMSIYDASMIYQAAGRAAADLRRPGVRHGVVARLGRQGHAPAGRPAPSSRSPSSASTAPTWSAWASCPASSRRASAPQTLGLDGTETFDLVGLEAGIKPRQDVDAGHPRARTARRRKSR